MGPQLGDWGVDLRPSGTAGGTEGTGGDSSGTAGGPAFGLDVWLPAAEAGQAGGTGVGAGQARAFIEALLPRALIWSDSIMRAVAEGLKG